MQFSCAISFTVNIGILFLVKWLTQNDVSMLLCYVSHLWDLNVLNTEGEFKKFILSI